jgi:hypothetical protein
MYKKFSQIDQALLSEYFNQEIYIYVSCSLSLNKFVQKIIKVKAIKFH